MIRYRAATTEDAAELSAVALAAKKHWGYPPAWIELWRSDLTVLPEQIEQDFLLVAETPARIAGFVGVSVEGPGAEIVHLWVLPEFMGRGIGRELMSHALRWCEQRAVGRLKVVSDPNARGFYEALGAMAVGEEPSVPAPRRLPVLQFDLREAPSGS
jgi:ribosomal protein S18 acetylase RimI-like enzyme